MGYLPVRIARIRILSGLGNDALGYLLKKGDITDAEYRAALEIPAVDFCTPAVFTDLPLIKRASNGPFLFHNILISLAGFPA